MAPHPDQTLLLPSSVLLLLLCIIVAAALINCGLIAALLKISRKGLSAILIQLAAVDFIMVCLIIGPEIWYNATATWPFSYLACKIYGGLEIFTTTLTLYLTLSAALHSAAVCIGAIRKAKRLKKNNEDDEEIRSSQHSLMASSDSSTPPRSFNDEFNLHCVVEVPVTPPSIFVWVLSASLSVPHFLLIGINIAKEGQISCSISDLEHQRNIYVLIGVFCVGLPTCIAIILGITMVKCLTEMKGLSVNFRYKCYIKLTICLMIVYYTLCLPKSVLNIYNALTQKLFTTTYLRSWTLSFNGTYLISALLRPILCITMYTKISKTIIFDKINSHQEM